MEDDRDTAPVPVDFTTTFSSSHFIGISRWYFRIIEINCLRDTEDDVGASW